MGFNETAPVAPTSTYTVPNALHATVQFLSCYSATHAKALPGHDKLASVVIGSVTSVQFSTEPNLFPPAYTSHMFFNKRM